jgi:chromosome partitioning protein
MEFLRPTGCGKTTIATHLAAAFANAGHATALADVDRQRSSLGWIERRPKSSARIEGVEWHKRHRDLPEGTERLVIDAPAAVQLDSVDDLVQEADIVIVPVLPSVFDEAATARFIKKLDTLKPIYKNKKAVAVVGNRVRSLSRAAARLDAFLGDIGHKTVTLLPDRAIYEEVAVRGLTLFDLSSQFAISLQADWSPLIQYIEKEG